jgi:hypothetical protein
MRLPNAIGRCRLLLLGSGLLHVLLALGHSACAALPSPDICWRNGVWKYYFSIVIVVRDEASYLPEWLEYHLIIGADHFFLYDNGSRDGPKARIEPYLRSGIVTYISWQGDGIQIRLYNDALARFGDTTFWMAFIDADEFLVPVSARHVPEFLRDHEQAAGIAVSWLAYSHSNQENRTKGLVIERFRAQIPGHRENHWSKVIVRPPRVVRMANVHRAVYTDAGPVLTTHNTPAEPNVWGILPEWQVFHDVVRINHYVFKSKEEFEKKRRRGGGVHGPNWRKWPEFDEAKEEESYEDKIMQPYVSLVKRRLRHRYGLAAHDTSLW